MPCATGLQPVLRSGLERFDPLGEARDLARSGVFVEHALADAALQDRLCRLKRGFGAVLLAGGDGALDSLDCRFDAAVAGAVDRGPLDGLAQALFRRLLMSHETFRLFGRISGGGLYRRPQVASTSAQAPGIARKINAIGASGAGNL